MSMLINVMMYALMIYLIIRMFTMNKSVNGFSTVGKSKIFKCAHKQRFFYVK